MDDVRKLKEENDRLREIIRELVTWERLMGGWESSCWKPAREVAKEGR